MRILYVGNVLGLTDAPRYYMAPLRIVNGFIRNGHTVVIFNDRDHARYSNIWRSSRRGVRAANRGLLKTVEEVRPELVVLGHCEMISNRTLDEIRKMIGGVKIIYRNVDSLVQSHNLDRLKRRSEAVDGIFLTTAGPALRQFEAHGAFAAYFPNLIDDSLDRHKAFESEEIRHDVFFAGEVIRDMEDVRKRNVDRIIRELSDLRLDFHGSIVGRPSLLGTAFLDALSHCRMGLSLDRTDEHWLYASDRMNLYLGNGMLTFVRRDKGFEHLFDDDEVAFYADLDELIAKCRTFATDDKAWREVAARGYAKARRHFPGDGITRYMVEKTFDLPPSQDFDWQHL